MTRIRPLVTVMLAAATLLSCSGKKAPVTIEQITNASYVTGIAVDGNTAYCATLGGLVVWDIPAAKYTILTTADGLPSNILNDVVIDGGGKLWVASDAGAAVRDGEEWKNFDTSNGLPSNVIHDLVLDRKGNVWAATDRGCVAFGKGRPRLLDDRDGPGEFAISTLHFDPGNNLWVGTVEKGIFAKIQGTWKNLGNGKGIISSGGKIITDSWDKRLLVGSPNSLARWEGEDGFITLDATSVMKTNSITGVVSTPEHTWIFSGNGVHAMRGDEWMHFTRTEGLLSNTVTCGFVVSDDRVFAGTPEGMSLIEKGVVTNYSIPNTPHGSDFVSLAVDGANRLLAGSSDAGLDVLQSGCWALFPGRDEQTLRNIRNTVFAPDGTVLFNTPDGIVSLRDREWGTITRDSGLSGNDVRCGVFDREGRLWAGTSAGLSCRAGNTWTRYRMTHGLPSEDIRACALDSAGTVWVGTAAGMISISGGKLTNWTEDAGADSLEVTAVAASGTTVYFGTADGRFLVYDGKSWDRSKPVVAPVTAILPDSSGVVWIASDGDGIVRTGRGGETKYSVAEGLPSNRVRAMVKYDGRLVAACRGGLGIIAPDPAKK